MNSREMNRICQGERALVLGRGNSFDWQKRRVISRFGGYNNVNICKEDIARIDKTGKGMSSENKVTISSWLP